MPLLEKLAKLCAVLAGVLLTVITLMTCVSLIGRNTTGWTIVGDFELSGAAAGAAIALFLPWCQARRGNIIVDFFSAKAALATLGQMRFRVEGDVKGGSPVLAQLMIDQGARFTSPSIWNELGSAPAKKAMT